MIVRLSLVENREKEKIKKVKNSSLARSLICLLRLSSKLRSAAVFSVRHGSASRHKKIKVVKVVKVPKKVGLAEAMVGQE